MGRPGLFGTALAGEAGAQHVLEIVRREMLTVMAQIGCPTVAEIGRDMIHAAPRADLRARSGEDAYEPA
jgi:isopentenyl diphosphate isomerase/L-lactate dehydrogenase-like FMN-dependent dehydrogenase